MTSVNRKRPSRSDLKRSRHRSRTLLRLRNQYSFEAVKETIGHERSIVEVDSQHIVDAIVGYRSWIAMPVGNIVYLRSIYQLSRWDVFSPLRARCLCGDKALKIWGEVVHTCGIHAWRESHQNELVEWITHEQVLGEVALWGEVHVHQRGYRAEFAKVKAIYTRSTLSEEQKLVRRAAAETYGVPLVIVDTE